MPQFDFQISAVSNTLRGVYPQDPLTNIYPENWYYTKKGSMTRAQQQQQLRHRPGPTWAATPEPAIFRAAAPLPART